MMEIKDRVALSARPGKLTLIQEGASITLLACYNEKSGVYAYLLMSYASRSSI